jgi:hypothetical protein
MLVVFFMHVWMKMFHHLMLVLVAMDLGDMEPDTCTHQGTGGNELSCYRFA